MDWEGPKEQNTGRDGASGNTCLCQERGKPNVCESWQTTQLPGPALHSHLGWPSAQAPGEQGLLTGKVNYGREKLHITIWAMLLLAVGEGGDLPFHSPVEGTPEHEQRVSWQISASAIACVGHVLHLELSWSVRLAVESESAVGMASRVALGMLQNVC